MWDFQQRGGEFRRSGFGHTVLDFHVKLWSKLNFSVLPMKYKQSQTILRTLHVVCREKFRKYLWKICEKIAKNLQKICEKLTFANFSGFFHEFFANFAWILIFRKFFANFLQIFHEFFTNFSQIFRKYFTNFNFSRIFRDYFATISRIFREYFTNISRIFREFFFFQKYFHFSLRISLMSYYFLIELLNDGYNVDNKHSDVFKRNYHFGIILSKNFDKRCYQMDRTYDL